MPLATLLSSRPLFSAANFFLFFFFFMTRLQRRLPRPGYLFTSSVGSPLGFLVFQGGIDPFGMWFACWRVLWPSLENDCEVNICLYLWYLAWGLVHKRTQGCRKTSVRTGNCTLLTYGCVCTHSSLLGSLILSCIYNLGPGPLMPNTDRKVHNDTVPGGIDGTLQWNSTCFLSCARSTMTLVSALVLGHSLLTKVNGLWFWVQCQL